VQKQLVNIIPTNSLLVQLRKSTWSQAQLATTTLPGPPSLKSKLSSKSFISDRQYQVNQTLTRLNDILLTSIIKVSNNIIYNNFHFIKNSKRPARTSSVLTKLKWRRRAHHWRKSLSVSSQSQGFITSTLHCTTVRQNPSSFQN
jgi:hypothetical protein